MVCDLRKVEAQRFGRVVFVEIAQDGSVTFPDLVPAPARAGVMAAVPVFVKKTKGIIYVTKTPSCGYGGKVRGRYG